MSHYLESLGSCELQGELCVDCECGRAGEGEAIGTVTAEGGATMTLPLGPRWLTLVLWHWHSFLWCYQPPGLPV